MHSLQAQAFFQVILNNGMGWRHSPMTSAGAGQRGSLNGKFLQALFPNWESLMQLLCCIT